MPQVIALAKDYLPRSIGQAPGLQGVVYGVVLIAFVLFEPLGLYGRWLKVRTYLQLFPFYRKGLFKRQKSFQKSDRLQMTHRRARCSRRQGPERALRRRAGRQQRQLRRAARRGVHADRPQRRRQDDGVQPDQPHLHADHRQIDVRGPAAAPTQPPHEIASLGIARTFQNIELFEHATVLHNLLIGRHTHRSTGLWSDLFFTGRRARAEIEAREKVERGDRAARPAAPPRLAWSPACPTACARWWSWRGRCAPSPSCCCWTSPRRA